MTNQRRYCLFIDGKWLVPSNGQWLDAVNPHDGKVWAQFPRGNSTDVDAAVAAAKRAFRSPSWRGITATARGKYLRRIGDLIETHSDRLAALETRDNGKLINEMRAQLKYIPEWFYFFGGLADKVNGNVLPIDKPEMLTFTRPEPYGVVAAITAWNSPLLLAAYKLAPALAAGNTVVLKPSEHASISTLELGHLLAEADLPPGVVNIVTGLGDEVGNALTGHPDVSKVTFTGSRRTGQAIARNCADSITKVTLELGGKSANIVFDDCDVERAAAGAVTAFLSAGGQTCVAGSRLLVQAGIYEEFLSRVVDMASNVRLGDPADPATDMGPMANRPQYDKVLHYLGIAKSEEVQCALGGGAATNPDLAGGWFIEPTIFTEVDPQSTIAREEIFGPVLAVMKFDDEDMAIDLANRSPYGLAAGIWTTDWGKGLRVGEQLDVGTVWINTYRVVSFLAPFGGQKQSGIGVENSAQAINEYLQNKTYWVSSSKQVENPFVIR